VSRANIVKIKSDPHSGIATIVFRVNEPGIKYRVYLYQREAAEKIRKGAEPADFEAMELPPIEAKQPTKFSKAVRIMAGGAKE
jgi:hypothetical protein